MRLDRADELTDLADVFSTELVLIDAGAEWGMYCSDMTRTVPASGRFSEAQRAVYDVVLAAVAGGRFAEVTGSLSRRVARGSQPVDAERLRLWVGAQVTGA